MCTLLTATAKQRRFISEGLYCGPSRSRRTRRQFSFALVLDSCGMGKRHCSLAQGIRVGKGVGPPSLYTLGVKTRR
jgi:hypothetical protein